MSHLLFLLNTIWVTKTGIVSLDGHLERREQRRNSYKIQCQSSAARHYLEEERILSGQKDVDCHMYEGKIQWWDVQSSNERSCFIKGRACIDYRPICDCAGDQPVPLWSSSSLCCRNPFPFLLLPKYVSAIYDGQFQHTFVQGTYFRNILYIYL